eukprot:12885420-Prorocentrum_lima.AAC.1
MVHTLDMVEKAFGTDSVPAASARATLEEARTATRQSKPLLEQIKQQQRRVDNKAKNEATAQQRLQQAADAMQAATDFAAN